MKQLQEDLKEHYHDHKTKRDECLLNKENLDQDAGEEEKANAIRNIKKNRTSESMLSEFSFPPRDRDISTINQLNTNSEVMENYEGVRRR